MEEDDSTMRVKSLGVRKVTGLGKKEGAGKETGRRKLEFGRVWRGAQACFSLFGKEGNEG